MKIIEKNIEGKILLQNVRFYRTSFKYDSSFPYLLEVDVLFKGKIRARKGHTSLEWYSSKIQKENGISKVKINRFIRKLIVDKIQNRLAYFGLKLNGHYEIKKLNWK